MFPFILLVSLAALVMGMLNAKNVFGMPAMASSFFNIGSIVGGVLLGAWIDPQFGPRALIGLAIGTLIGGALQLGVQLPQLRRLGYHFRPDFAWRDAGVSAILALMGPSVIAASTTQFNVLINSMFASTLGDGPIFWLSIAFRLMQLPLGLFGVALGTVTLPLLSRLAVAGDMGAFRGELSRGMRLAFLLTVPSTVGLMMLAEPIISVLYQHGRFDAHQTAQAAGALRFYAIGLCGYAALKVLVNAFYALDRRKTPMLVSFLAVALNLLFNWIFTFQSRLGASRAGVLDRLRGELQFPGAVRAHASAAQAAGDAPHAGDAGQGGGGLLPRWRRSAGRRSTGCWRHGRHRRSPANSAALLLTVVVGALVFVGCGAALRIEELHDADGRIAAPSAAHGGVTAAGHSLVLQTASPLSNTMRQVLPASSRQTELKRPTTFPSCIHRPGAQRERCPRRGPRRDPAPRRTAPSRPSK